MMLISALVAAALTATVTVPQLSQSIPQGAQRVPILSVRLTASCKESVRVSALSVEHHGLGSANDIARVYVLQGTKRLSRSAVVPQRDPVELRFAPITVPACGVQDILVAADIAPGAVAGGEHAFILSNVDSTAPVKIVADIRPAAIPVTAHPSQSTIRAELVQPLGVVSYGKNQMVARVRLNGVGYGKQHVIAITLHNQGSASNADLQQIFLEKGNGERVSEFVRAMDGRDVRIPLLPTFMLSGSDEVLLNVRADRRSSSRRTIRWELEETSDIEVERTGRR